MDALPAERHIPWNRGKLTGQKPPLKLREIWGIRIRLQLAGDTRDLALFNLAIDSKLRGCDLVRLRVLDISHQGGVMHRATIVQRKTGRPVQFELTDQTRQSVAAWLRHAGRTAPWSCAHPKRSTGRPREKFAPPPEEGQRGLRPLLKR